MPRRYVMAISCICHYRPAHKLVTAHLECRTPLRMFVLSSFSLCPPSLPSHPSSLVLFSAINHLYLIYLSHFLSFTIPLDIRTLCSFFTPSGCHRVVCIAVAKRRSLSSLINVDSLLIYRRVVVKVNDALLERTTLGIPVAR